MKATIVLLPGDGIGAEVVLEGRKVLETVAACFEHHFTFEERRIGGIAIDEDGEPLPAATLDACAKADAVLLGAVGGPKWDDPKAKTRPEQGLLGLRKGLGLFANLRPVRVHPALASASPLKPELLDGVDVLFVRELTGGLYFGKPRLREVASGKRRAVDTLEYGEDEIARVVRLAFQLARGRKRRVTSVDKANVLESSRLWREIAVEISAEFPDVALDHQLVDSCAMRIIDRHMKAIHAVASDCSSRQPAGTSRDRSKTPMLSIPRKPPSKRSEPSASLRLTHQLKFRSSLVRTRLRKSVSRAPSRR